ncbi:hypothetical protein D3C76_904430 [compost metagenome]
MCFTALKAASLTIFARSAPTAPGVDFAIASILTSLDSFTSFECTLRIDSLPIKSGLSTITLLSNLPGLNKALSKISGLLVAASITTPFEESKPSISARS